MLNIINLYIYILHITQIGMITNHLRICRPCTVHPPALAEPWRPTQRNFVLGRLWGDERAILMGIYSW